MKKPFSPRDGRSVYDNFYSDEQSDGEDDDDDDDDSSVRLAEKCTPFQHKMLMLISKLGSVNEFQRLNDSGGMINNYFNIVLPKDTEIRIVNHYNESISD